MTASTISTTAEAGAYQAEVLRKLTISSPPSRVLLTIALSFSFDRSSVTGTPPTVEYRVRGTIVSPWPPSTNARVLSTETPRASARNQRMRAESSTPAIPKTRSRGKPETRRADSHNESRGFETTIRIALGDSGTILRTTSETIPSFVATRSSRLIPGLRGTPAVMTTTSDCLVSSEEFDPIILASNPSTGADSSMSRDLPWGSPGMMSTRTTSAISFSTIRCATVAPTLPAPTTVTFCFICPIIIRTSECQVTQVHHPGPGGLVGAFGRGHSLRESPHPSPLPPGEGEEWRPREIKPEPGPGALEVAIPPHTLHGLLNSRLSTLHDRPTGLQEPSPLGGRDGARQGCLRPGGARERRIPRHGEPPAESGRGGARARRGSHLGRAGQAPGARAGGARSAGGGLAAGGPGAG